MDRWRKKVAIVTGASSGIGAAIARALVNEGMIVIGFARRKEKMEREMESVKDKGTFYARKVDVTNEDLIKEAFESIKKEFGSVHVLVNNAGIAIPGKILETESSVWQDTFNVNCMGLLYCTREAVKILQESGEDGHIINIKSILGHRIPRQPVFALNVYPGTKFAVAALTSTLEDELIGTKIKVSCISPGLVKTEIFDFNTVQSDWPAMESEEVASAVVYALSSNRNVQIRDIIIAPINEIF